MRILHYLSEITLVHGGVVRSVLDISKGLAARGHDVTLLSFDDTSVPPEWKGAPADGRPHAIRLNWPRYPKPVRKFAPLDLALAADHIRTSDVLHLHGPWESTNVQLAAVARRLGKPYIVSTHGMLDDWCMAQGGFKKRLFLRMWSRAMLEGAARVLCTAQGEKEQAGKWFPRAIDRCEVLPLPFDLDSFTNLPGPEPARSAFEAARTDGPIILFLSRLHPKKGVELLIDACAILKREPSRDGAGRRFRLVIAGSGDPAYEQALKTRAIDSGLSDRAYFVGMVAGIEKISLFERADVSVLPTSQENWGFVLLESLAAGTPVVTTKGVDIWPELQNTGGSVIVYPTPQAIAKAVGALLDDPKRVEAMGEAGRAAVLEWLKPERVLGEYERVYRDVSGATRMP